MSFANRSENKSQQNHKEKSTWQKINGCLQEIKWNTKNNVKSIIYLSENKRNVQTYSAPVCEIIIISGINVSWALKINLTEERKLLENVFVTINFENNLYATKPKKGSNESRWVKTTCTCKSEGESIILKLFNGLWTIRARYLQKKL